MRAPLDGVILPLEQMPDPVFLQKIVGDDVSIDPLKQTRTAPTDGTVAQVHRAAHAVTPNIGDGVDLVMHIGRNTVELKG
jgi:phosphocarrier protein FPr